MTNKSRIRTLKEFSKFSLVGIINTSIHLSLLYVLTEFFSIWYLLSSFLAFLVALTNSFIMNTLWTFKKNIKHKTINKYTKFLTISIIAAILNLFLLYVFTEFVGLWYMISQIIAIIFTLMINFIGNKFWTFK